MREYEVVFRQQGKEDIVEWFLAPNRMGAYEQFQGLYPEYVTNSINCTVEETGRF